MIEESLNDRSYTVKERGGYTYRRNRVHRRKCTTPEAGSVSSADPSGVPESEMMRRATTSRWPDTMATPQWKKSWKNRHRQ